MSGDPLTVAAADLLERCRSLRLTIATAESCTGGLIAAALTDIAGASDVFERGFVTYSNAAKVDCLGVSPATLERRGAVSEDVAREMAAGALRHSAAQLALSVTGIAGPGGGTSEKPVGLVHLAAANRDGRVLHQELRTGNIGRTEIREAAALAGIALLRELT